MSSSSSSSAPLTCYYDARGLQIGATDANGKFFAASPGGSAFVPGASRRVSLPLDWELAAYGKGAAQLGPAAAALLARAGILVTL